MQIEKNLRKNKKGYQETSHVQIKRFINGNQNGCIGSEIPQEIPQKYKV